MVWGLSVALLLVATLGLEQQPRLEPGLLGLRHTYDCGMKGLQLLVFPPPGWTVRFKVVGECWLDPGPHLPGLQRGAGSPPLQQEREEQGPRPACGWLPPSPHIREGEGTRPTSISPATQGSFSHVMNRDTCPSC